MGHYSLWPPGQDQCFLSNRIWVPADSWPGLMSITLWSTPGWQTAQLWGPFTIHPFRRSAKCARPLGQAMSMLVPCTEAGLVEGEFFVCRLHQSLGVTFRVGPVRVTSSGVLGLEPPVPIAGLAGSATQLGRCHRR